MTKVSDFDSRYSYATNSHYGASSDLLKLSEALHARGMYLMVDIVVNNMVRHTPISTLDKPSN